MSAFITWIHAPVSMLYAVGGVATIAAALTHRVATSRTMAVD